MTSKDAGEYVMIVSNSAGSANVTVKLEAWNPAVPDHTDLHSIDHHTTILISIIVIIKIAPSFRALRLCGREHHLTCQSRFAGEVKAYWSPDDLLNNLTRYIALQKNDRDDSR
nr:hypothetical protein BaRGS_031073 [Batillaria attramentaria]